ncbi:GNAT family N-acetyltransferase [Novosphingobium lentum]|uniref:GNAT family N-acetyltransferase n=1 Tax=Novosphingobium lentum TaxID=145287 RepID=UPI0008299ACF|nr:GNAT family protein [Novosphingobium lentum]
MSDGLHIALGGGDLILEPLAERHREGLRAACAQDAEIWQIYPFTYLGDAFDPQFGRMLAGGAVRRCYAIVTEGEIAGMTAWIEHGAPGWSIEIGNSYIVPALRGTGFNRRFKALMLDHAFACGLARVAFKVDAINARSRAAVLKLGCSEEGTMRHERQTWTGRLRDTVLFSILRDEWKTDRP